MTQEQQKNLQQLSLFTDEDFIKTSKFYLIKAISEMNVSMLEVILKDKYSYQDTTKELFLEKLNQIFEEHKNNGDTALFYYQGGCVVKDNICENCGKRGFRFVGNISNNHLDLIFELEDDNIKDIYHCARFETDDKLEDLKHSTSIYINEDDKVTFDKSPEYWAKVNAAEAAYLEIICTPTRKLDFEEVCYWIDKHFFTNNTIGNYSIFEPPMKWTSYSRLYEELNEIKIFIESNFQEIIDENECLKQIVSEEVLIDWVIKQELIIKTANTTLLYGFSKNEDYIKALEANYVNLFGNVFNQVFNYIEVFQKHKNELFEKYKVYTFGECLDIENEREWNENNVDLFSLSFHIQTRRKLESEGIVVPLYKN